MACLAAGRGLAGRWARGGSSAEMVALVRACRSVLVLVIVRVAGTRPWAAGRSRFGAGGAGASFAPVTALFPCPAKDSGAGAPGCCRACRPATGLLEPPPRRARLTDAALTTAGMFHVLHAPRNAVRVPGQQPAAGSPRPHI